MLDKCPFDPQVTFQVNNPLSSQEFPFGDIMPFRSKNALSGHKCPFRSKIPFQAEDALSSNIPLRDYNALSGQAYPFGQKMPSWAEISLSVHDCPFGTRIPFWDTHENQPYRALHNLFFLSPTCALVLINWTGFAIEAFCRGILHGLLTAKSTERS